MVKTIGAWGQDRRAFTHWIDHAQASVIVLVAVARIRLLDYLGDVPRSAGELAAETGFDAAQIDRLLTFLAAQEVLTLGADGRYAHTEVSRLLRSDHPASVQPMLFTMENTLQAGLALPLALRTGTTGQQAAHGKSFFQMLGDDAEKAEVFARFMTATTIRSEQFMFTEHAFMPFELAVDVGGNHGSLLLRLLAMHPQARGVLFDMPDVVARAGDALAAHPAGARVETVGGSFFEAVPAGGDLYLLKQILHDWGDEECLAILRAIRAAIAPGGRLAVFDRLIPDTPRPHPAYNMDLYMMLLLGARERKLSQFEVLFAASGFRLDRVTEDPDGLSVIEAVPV